MNIIYSSLFNSKNVIVMNKTELVQAIAEKAGLSKVQAKAALDAMIEAIGCSLKDGKKVALIGFGAFDVVKKAERQGINPRTKAAITIPAKKVIKFKAGAELNNKVNG